jgi:hypothetical protein
MGGYYLKYHGTGKFWAFQISKALGVKESANAEFYQSVFFHSSGFPQTVSNFSVFICPNVSAGSLWNWHDRTFFKSG